MVRKATLQVSQSATLQQSIILVSKRQSHFVSNFSFKRKPLEPRPSEFQVNRLNLKKLIPTPCTLKTNFILFLLVDPANDFYY